MGLIAARPEEPDEWMGIPSEPRDVESGVDRLDSGPPPAADAFGLFSGETVSSIAIAVSAESVVPVESAEPGSTPTLEE